MAAAGKRKDLPGITAAQTGPAAGAKRGAGEALGHQSVTLDEGRRVIISF